MKLIDSELSRQTKNIEAPSFAKQMLKKAPEIITKHGFSLPRLY